MRSAVNALVPIRMSAIRRFYRDQSSNVLMGSRGADFHIPITPFIRRNPFDSKAATMSRDKTGKDAQFLL